MKEIYIVLVRAHTGLGTFARLCTGYPYTHIAISLNRSLTDFISFSRRRHAQPFDAGLTHEKRDYYAFGRHQGVRVKVFQLPLQPVQARQIEQYIQQCASDTQMRFNLFSMATMPLLHGFPIAHAENCMSFTAKIVRLSRCVPMKKPCYRYSIRDLDTLLTRFLWFEGNLPRISSTEYAAYMQPCCLSETLRAGATLCWQLAKRMAGWEDTI